MTVRDAGPGVVASRTAATALAGALAGIVVGGVGGRIAMRVSSLLDPAARGARTEAGFTVGEFTLGGTIEFVVFVGLLGGLIAAVMWSLVSPFLPRTPGPRRLGAFVVAGALGGRLAVEGRNFDFRILEPALLQAAIYVVLAGMVGVVAASVEPVVVRRFENRGRLLRAGSWFILFNGVLLVVPLTSLFFNSDACNCASLPWLVGIALYALGAVWLIRLVNLLRDRPPPQWLLAAGRGLLVLTTLAGFAHLAGEIAHFV